MDLGVIPGTAPATVTPEEKHVAGSKALEHSLLVSGGLWFRSHTPASRPEGGMPCESGPVSSPQACDRLLAHRVETKMKGNKVNEVLNRLHLAMPNKRDDKVRLAFPRACKPAPASLGAHRCCAHSRGVKTTCVLTYTSAEVASAAHSTRGA